MHACSREPWTVEWIEKHVQSSDVLYDIGANVGAYALVAAMRSGGAARVVAFEPGAATFLSPCHNVAVNQVADRLTPLPIALAAETQLANFNYRSLSAGPTLWNENGGSAQPRLHAGVPPACHDLPPR